jgi:hypothetical protein
MAYFEVIFKHTSGGNEKIHRTSRRERSIAGPKVKLGSFEIRSRTWYGIRNTEYGDCDALGPRL